MAGLFTDLREMARNIFGGFSMLREPKEEIDTPRDSVLSDDSPADADETYVHTLDPRL